MNRKIFILLFALTITGCSTQALFPAEESSEHFSSIGLYMSRKTLKQTSFEQIKLVGTTVIAECGEIKRGRPIISQQNIETINATQDQAINTMANSISKIQNETLDEAGTNSSLFDPGILKLTLKGTKGTKSLKTSLDSISEGTSKGEKQIFALARDLRQSTGSYLCGRKDFFGVGEKSSKLP